MAPGCCGEQGGSIAREEVATESRQEEQSAGRGWGREVSALECVAGAWSGCAVWRSGPSLWVPCCGPSLEFRPRGVYLSGIAGPYGNS